MVLFSLCEAPLDDWANGSSVDVLSRMVSMVLVLWGYEMKCYIATFQEFHSRYKLFNDMHIGHITVSQWLVIQSSAQVNQDRFPAGQNFYFLSDSDIVEILFKTNGRRNSRPNFCYFCGLECFNCW